MGIKVVDNNKKPKTKDFPKLMVSNTSGNIGLVDANREDITLLYVTSGNAATVGQRYFAQDLSNWREYNEPLTLQNE